MSLAIDIDKVSQVLLADGWHIVDGESFALDAYEYIWQDSIEGGLGGGQEPLIPSRGFMFTEWVNSGNTKVTIAGPLTSIIAVRL